VRKNPIGTGKCPALKMGVFWADSRRCGSYGCFVNYRKNSHFLPMGDNMETVETVLSALCLISPTVKTVGYV